VADAIHRFDSKALVNTGSWSHFASTQVQDLEKQTESTHVTPKG
jgi:phosphoserine aminotransferase